MLINKHNLLNVQIFEPFPTYPKTLNKHNWSNGGFHEYKFALKKHQFIFLWLEVANVLETKQSKGDTRNNIINAILDWGCNRTYFNEHSDGIF